MDDQKDSAFIPEPGQAAWTEEGDELQIISVAPSGHILAHRVLASSGDAYEPFISDRVSVFEKVYCDPPFTKRHAAIGDLQLREATLAAEVSRLRKQKESLDISTKAMADAGLLDQLKVALTCHRFYAAVFHRDQYSWSVYLKDCSRSETPEVSLKISNLRFGGPTGNKPHIQIYISESYSSFTGPCTLFEKREDAISFLEEKLKSISADDARSLLQPGTAYHHARSFAENLRKIGLPVPEVVVEMIAESERAAKAEKVAEAERLLAKARQEMGS